MNILDATVTKILTEPYFKYNKYWVDVEYECYGHSGKTSIMFCTEELAKEVTIGYVIQV